MANRRNLKLKTLATDLEYSDDIAFLTDNWADLTTMLDSLVATCKKLGLAISCKKTKILAVLTNPGAQSQASIQLVPGGEPIKVVSHFQYLGSTVQNDCGMDAEVNSQICNPFTVSHFVVPAEDPDQHQGSHPKQCHPSNLAVWSGKHCLPRAPCSHLDFFMIHCLRIILGVSIRKKKCHTTMCKMAKQQRISSIHLQHCLHFLGHLSRMPKDRLPR